MSEAALPLRSRAAQLLVARPERRHVAGPLLLDLAVFAGLAALALGQWARLVAAPPPARLALALACVLAGAAGLAALGRLDRRRRLTPALAIALAGGATLAALVSLGLPARLLAPGSWGELIDNVGAGLAGIEDNELPYAGGDVWLRLTLLLGAPLLVGIAAALAFWPTPRRGRLRLVALIVLIGGYGIAVTLDSPPAELLWGLPLLLLSAAWLWAPEFAPRRSLPALATVAAAGLLAIPIAAAVDRDRAWWDYESWDWFGGERAVKFDWEHSYGPLEWPRQGTLLLEVTSPRPLYWKAEILDRFDGFAWTRAVPAQGVADAELAARRHPLGATLAERNPRWLTAVSFEVGALRSRLVIGAGTSVSIEGVGGLEPGRDGTTRVAGEPLGAGDEYSVNAYAPEPTTTALRDAPQTYPGRARASTAIGLSLSDSVVPRVIPPLWGEPRARVGQTLSGTSYAGMYALARRLTAGASTPYDAARAVETHLRSAYEYSPAVPQYQHALPAFLFVDRSGYCQQFAGSMALMLRMVGIPTRVVSGFAPGSFDLDRRVYEVRDFDAHSWVEVYFRGIGWVPFDPTPASAPAGSQRFSPSIDALLRLGEDVPGLGGAAARPLERNLRGGGPVPDRAGGDGSRVGRIAGAAGIVAAVGALGFGTVSAHRRRRLVAGEAAEDQLREFGRAIERLGWRVNPGSTLLAIERRFTGVGRRGVSRYAAALRESRFGAGSSPPPGPRERRALRSALAARGGPRRWIRALLAIPPGGPARR